MHKYLSGVLFFMLIACGTKSDTAGLCERFFEPYPDLISGRQAVSAHNQIYVNGMALYARGEYEQAADSLKAYIRQRGYEKSAHLYLAMCLLTMDLPFDAELQLDHLENSTVQGYKDQTQWYTLICWLCSGQYERALPEARRIAALPRHTYRQQAARLADELERKVAA